MRLEGELETAVATEGHRWSVDVGAVAVWTEVVVGLEGVEEVIYPREEL